MIVRRATHNDVGAIVNLVNEVFGLNRDLEWFTHFHLKNPNGKSILWVAQDDNGDIVSYRSIVRFKAYYLDHMIQGGQLADACTRPDCRGRGIYSRVNAEALKDFFTSGGEMAYSFPSPSNYRILVGRFGFQSVADFRQGFCPLSSYPASGIFQKLAKQAHRAVFLKRMQVDPGVTMVSAAEVMDGLAFSTGEGSRLTFDRSRDFLRWRTSIPGRRYWIALIDGQNYAIVGEAYRRGLRVCTIADIRCTNRYAKNTLLKGIQTWGDAKNYDGVYAWLSRDWFVHVSAGFVPAPGQTNLVVRFNDEFPLRQKLGRPEVWNVRLLDTDAY